MKNLLVTVTLMLSLVSAAGANDVQWALTGPPEVESGAPVTWQASVAVAGANQGLAGYAFNIVVGPAPGPGAGPDEQWGTADDTNVANLTLSPAAWVNSFRVGGGPLGSVKETGAAGGPGLNVLPYPGANAIRKGELIQVGAGTTAWTPYTGGSGGQTAGVGLADRKTALLADPNGTYVLNSGSIPTAGLPGGEYVAVLVPVAARVLRPDLSFAQPQPGFIMTSAASATGASFAFRIVVSNPVKPDFDRDGDVDAADLQRFVACFSGPAIPQEDVPCRAADFDEDGDVDLSDFGIFQRCFSGTGQSPNPSCAQ